MKISNSVQMIIVLAVVSLLSASGLVYVYQYAQPKIAINQQRELEAAIFTVLPAAAGYDAIQRNGETFYVGKDRNNRIIGYAVVAGGAGYQGQIVVIAGLDRKMETLLGIAVVESVETPGLGGMIAGDDFQKQFNQLSMTPQIDLVKDAPQRPNEVQAITGATVSSRAVVSILNDKITIIRDLLKEAKR